MCLFIDLVNFCFLGDFMVAVGVTIHVSERGRWLRKGWESILIFICLFTVILNLVSLYHMRKSSNIVYQANGHLEQCTCSQLWELCKY